MYNKISFKKSGIKRKKLSVSDEYQIIVNLQSVLTPSRVYNKQLFLASSTVSTIWENWHAIRK